MSSNAKDNLQGRPDTSTRSWFAVSIAITVLLVGFLLWHLVYSYQLMVSFREREFVIERSSWQLLLYAESMQMYALVAATSGDINWERNYLETRPQLENVLQKIQELMPSQEVEKIVEEINEHLTVINELEEEVFSLLKRGEKREAYNLLSGWEYTKNRMDFSDRTRDLTELIQKRLQERTAYDTTRLAVLLVLGGLGVLVLSWVITLRIWRMQVRKKQEAEENISLLLNNSGQGFMLADENLLVDPNYSLECENIFGPRVAGNSLPDLLYPEGGYDREHFAGSLRMLMQEEDDFIQDNIISLLPEQLYVNHKYLKLQYRLISSTQIMLIITDITEKVLLEKEIQEEHKRLSFVVSALENKNDLLETLREYENFLEESRKQQKGDKPSTGPEIDQLFRKVHTFKGVFMQYEMPYTPEALHSVEQGLAEAARGRVEACSTPGSGELLPGQWLLQVLSRDKQVLVDSLGKGFLDSAREVSVSEDSLAGMESKAQELLESHAVPEQVQQGLSQLLYSLKKLRYKSLQLSLGKYARFVQQMADRSGKLLHPLHIQGDDIYFDPRVFNPFIKSLVHVFRNAVAHGIEDPEERLEKGKPESGQIQCRIENTPEGFVLSISDDGSGVDLEGLREKLRESGAYSLEELGLMDEKELLMQIFTPGVSTAAEADKCRGRGVGMDAVSAAVEALGGSIEVKSAADLGTEVVFYLPGQGCLKI